MTQRTGSKTTKHTCGGPSFGRKTPGCPRCDELIAGAAPVQQAWRNRPTRAQQDEQRCREIRAHFAAQRRIAEPRVRCSLCGADGALDKCWNCGAVKAHRPVCDTFGEW